MKSAVALAMTLTATAGPVALDEWAALRTDVGALADDAMRGRRTRG